jgi:hypothetical protein
MDPRPHFHWGQASTGMTFALAFVNYQQKMATHVLVCPTRYALTVPRAMRRARSRGVASTLYRGERWAHSASSLQEQSWGRE